MLLLKLLVLLLLSNSLSLGSWLTALASSSLTRWQRPLRCHAAVSGKDDVTVILEEQKVTMAIKL